MSWVQIGYLALGAIELFSFISLSLAGTRKGHALGVNIVWASLVLFDVIVKAFKLPELPAVQPAVFVGFIVLIYLNLHPKRQT